MTAAHNPDDFTDLLYKYTDFNGAQKTLSTRKLRFTRPSEMNDPFDVRIDQWMAMEYKPFYELIAPRFIERMLLRPEEFARLTGMGLQDAQAFADEYQRQPESERTARIKEMAEFALNDFESYLPKLQRSTEEIRTVFAESFNRYGILCATRTFRNVLMWAHYANKHRGVVLGFRADLEKDSMLRLMRPVRYSDVRPHAIDTPAEFIENLDIPPNLAARKIADKLFHTKSAEWAYEEEVRLFIPDGVAEGETAGHFGFLANELEEIYLGYRMTDDNKAEIVRLAKGINPDVRILAAHLAQRKYALEFDPV